MVDDHPEGQGRWQWADGQVTLGEWINGECSALTSELQKRQLHGIKGHATRGAAASVAAKTNSVPTTTTNIKVKTKKTVDYCISCKTQCDLKFQCLNCTTGFCETCEKSNRKQGFQKRRPPCKCMIHEDGRAVAIQIVALNQKDIFDQWNVHKILGHFIDRKASTSPKHIIFNIRFLHKEHHGLECTSLCEVGRLNTLSQTKLFEQRLVREYVKTCSPKPAAFANLEKRWNAPLADTQVDLRQKNRVGYWFHLQIGT